MARQWTKQKIKKKLRLSGDGDATNGADGNGDDGVSNNDCDLETVAEPASLLNLLVKPASRKGEINMVSKMA